MLQSSVFSFSLSFLFIFSLFLNFSPFRSIRAHPEMSGSAQSSSESSLVSLLSSLSPLSSVGSVLPSGMSALSSGASGMQLSSPGAFSASVSSNGASGATFLTSGASPSPPDTSNMSGKASGGSDDSRRGHVSSISVSSGAKSKSGSLSAPKSYSASGLSSGMPSSLHSASIHDQVSANFPPMSLHPSSLSLASSSPTQHSPQMMTTPKFNIPKLNKGNYQEWKHHIDAALYLSSAKIYVESNIKFEDVRDSPIDAYHFLSAFTMLNNNITAEVRHNLGAVEPYSPYHLYKSVCELFEPKSSASRLHSHRKFFHLSCATAKDVPKFCTVIEQMCKKLHTKSLFSDDTICKIFKVEDPSHDDIKEKRRIMEDIITVLEDIDKMAVLIGGLPDSFETIVTILENDPKSCYATCKESILNHAHKLVQESVESGEKLNTVSTSSPSSQASSSTSSQSSVKKCAFCNKQGHTIDHCLASSLICGIIFVVVEAIVVSLPAEAEESQTNEDMVVHKTVTLTVLMTRLIFQHVFLVKQRKSMMT